MKSEQDNKELTSMRLDKWLWCARFFKTRSLAADAIKGGKVLVNEDKPKPSKTIQAGTRLKIRNTPYQFDITITLLAKSRKSARDAMLLYYESEESTRKREEITARLKLDLMNNPRTTGRPTKRDRRHIIRFKTNGNTD
jgi:ribosome-associated heat shock protein Hsp15